MRHDWLLAFVAGVLSMAGLGYIMWKSAGQPPEQP